MIDVTRALVGVLGAALALAAAACDGGTLEGSPTPTASRPVAPASPGTRPPPAPFPPPPVTSTPAVTPTASPGPIVSPPLTPTSTAAPPSPPGTPTAAPTVPAGRVEQLAPIEGYEVRSEAGGTAIARITSGLPSGCAVYSRAVVSRTGTNVTVQVYNHLPTGHVACTAIYGMVSNEVSLGAGFTAGVAYAIDVNGTRQTFTPR